MIGWSSFRVVQALHIFEVGDVERRDVVAQGEREVSELAVIRDIRVYGNRILGLVTEVKEQFSDALLAVGTDAEWVR